jgi:hypothetical protein
LFGCGKSLFSESPSQFMVPHRLGNDGLYGGPAVDVNG